jgi:hypothetical protein
MSDLTLFRDHARRMADAQHTLDCEARREDWELALRRHARWDNFPHPGPKPECWGCVTDADRALWIRLADEADAYLARNVDEGLFA